MRQRSANLKSLVKCDCFKLTRVSVFFPCVALSLTVVGCYFTRDPRSTSLSAKAHGRVGMIIKALELMLSVTYALEGTFGLPMRLVRVHSICRASL